MRFSSPSLFGLITVMLAFTSAQASPLGSHNDNQVDAIARSMLGSTNNAVSWDSLPLERSPSDPDREVNLEKRIVYNPPITYPTKSTVWTAGQKVHVLWDVKQQDLPANGGDPNASIMLGYLLKGSNYNEHLSRTLADKFPIKDGKVSFVLPSDLPTRSDYIVVLLGDSGNRSQRFTINAANATSAATKEDANIVQVAAPSLLGRDLA